MSISPIPADASEVVRAAFAVANDAVSQRLCRLPNTWEVTLDQAFIDTLAGIGGPVVVASGWTVRIETHFLGGGRHWPGPDWELMPYRRWEIADIGVIVMIRNGSELKRTKLALFQSKRLYPNEQSMDEIELSHYWRGFSRLYEDDEIAADASAPRVFTFSDDSEYRMVLVGDEQVARIRVVRAAQKSGALPALQPGDRPVDPVAPDPRERHRPEFCRGGLPRSSSRRRTERAEHAPSRSVTDVRGARPGPSFAVPTSPECRWQTYRGLHGAIGHLQGGIPRDGRGDSTLGYVFNRRGAPIVAAIGITLSSPIDDDTY